MLHEKSGKTRFRQTAIGGYLLERNMTLDILRKIMDSQFHPVAPGFRTAPKATVNDKAKNNSVHKMEFRKPDAFPDQPAAPSTK